MDQVQPQPAEEQLLGETGLAPLRLPRLLGDLAGLPLADMFGNGHRGPPLSRCYYTTSLLGHGAREHQVVTLEEALRWEPPISTVVRVARRGCELGGIAIPAGTSVSVIVAEANRDPDQNPEPDGPTRRGRTSRI